jgi:serine/threonine protein kinase
MVLRVQRQIRSEGIGPLLHGYLNNDPPCLEFPYIGGGTMIRQFDECRESEGSFSPPRAQEIIQQIAEIIGQAHRANPRLIHRDLEPSNVLVERFEDGKFMLRVTDFVIGAVASQPVLDQSRSGSSMVGNLSSVLTGAYSPLYASPRQMRGNKADPRDDVYALGVI